MESSDKLGNVQCSPKKGTSGRIVENMEKRRKRLEIWRVKHKWQIGGYGESYDRKERRDYLIVPGKKQRGVLIPWSESGISYTLYTHNNALKVQELLKNSKVIHPVFKIVQTRSHNIVTPYTVREHIDGKTLNKILERNFLLGGKIRIFWKFISIILRKNLEKAGLIFSNDINLSRVQRDKSTGGEYNSADTANIDLNGGNAILMGFNLVDYLEDKDVSNLTEESVEKMLDKINENGGKIVLFDFDDWITPDF